MWPLFSLAAATALLAGASPVAATLAADAGVVLAAMARLRDLTAQAAELLVVGAAILQRIAALAANLAKEIDAIFLAYGAAAVFSSRFAACLVNSHNDFSL